MGTVSLFFAALLFVEAKLTICILSPITYPSLYKVLTMCVIYHISCPRVFFQQSYKAPSSQLPILQDSVDIITVSIQRGKFTENEHIYFFYSKMYALLFKSMGTYVLLSVQICGYKVMILFW